MVPVEDVNPPGLLKPRVYIDLVGLKANDASERLIKQIKGDRAKPDKPPVFPGSADSINIPRPGFPGELPHIWNIPKLRNPNFTGRDEYLSKLANELKSGHHAALTQAIRGMGGIGKTQIALEYAYRYSTNYQAIWWLRAEDGKTLSADYALFAVSADLPEKDAPEEQIVINAVRDWLERNQNWLFIFDNAIKPEDVSDYLPRGASGHVLITSRHKAWEELCRSLSIDIWSREESVDFLIRRTKDKNKSSAVSVAEELGDLPLALEQAAAFINETGIGFDEYLKLYLTRRSELWEEENPPLGYPDTVGTTYTLAIEKVQEEAPAGTLVLNLSSYFAPDEIPRSLISEASEYLPEESSALINDSLVFNKGIKALNHYSLVNAQNNNLSVHRLVQMVVRDRLDVKEQKIWSNAAIQMINANFPSEGYEDPGVWPKCAELLSHGHVVVEHAVSLGVALETVADLLNSIAVYQLGRASYSDAEQLIRRALEINEIQFEPGHPSIARSQSNLATVLQDLGELEEAHDLLRHALESDQKSFEPGHPGIAISQSNLALVLMDLGKLEEARDLLRHALESDQKSFEPGHPSIAIRQSNLATVLKDLGELEEARDLLRQALESDQKSFEPGHPSIARSQSNLALVLQDLGELEEARELIQSAYNTFLEKFGENHHYTAITKENFKSIIEGQ